MALRTVKLTLAMKPKVALLSAILFITLLVLLFSNHLSLPVIQTQIAGVLDYIEHNRIRGILIFMVLYFIVCALPMPFVSIPTILAGYLFGNVQGLLIVSFMSALGSTFLFLMTRYLFRQWVQQRFTKQLAILSQKSGTTSFITAISLRLIPGMPFSIPAIILSISKIGVLPFYVSTQLGLLTTLFIYVNAGRSLSTIHSINDLFNLPLIASMLLLAVVPLLLGFISRKKELTS